MGNRRIWCGLGVMLVGACAAWPFRKTWLPEECAPQKSSAAAAVPLVDRHPLPTRLTRSLDEQPSPSAEAASPQVELQPLLVALDRGVPTRPLAKVEESAQLPSMASDYSPQLEPYRADPRSAVVEGGDSSGGAVESNNSAGQPRRYRIGKHDTLEGIAERLLGSRQHADKLLAANPGVILVPQILPVGATIVIPDLHQAAETLVRVPQPRD